MSVKLKSKVAFLNKKPKAHLPKEKLSFKQIQDRIKQNSRSLKTKITVRFIAVMLVAAVTLVSVGVYTTYQSNIKTVQLTSRSTLSAAAGVVASSLDLMIENASVVCTSDVLTNEETPLEEKMKTVKLLRSLNLYVEVGFVDKNGNGFLDNQMQDLSAQEHFKTAIAGENYISEPQIFGKNNKMSVIAAVPNYSADTVMGTVYVVDEYESINDKIAELTFGKTGYAYVINKDGTVIYHKDKLQVENQFNAISAAQKDDIYADTARVTQEILQNETGTAIYNEDGIKYFTAYAGIPQHEEWKIVLKAPYSEFMGGVGVVGVLGAIASIIMLIISVIFARAKIAKIVLPLKGVQERIQSLAEGDLTQPVPEAVSQDEIGLLATALSTTVSDLRNYISNISEALGQMSQGNFGVKLKGEFNGDFAQMRIDIEKMLEAFNDILGKLNISATSVAESSSSVASDASALARGAKQQTKAISALLDTIENFRQKTKENVQSVYKAKANAESTGQRLTQNNAQMTQLVEAMNEISRRSVQIGKIVNTIEDISMQTNILALNASVEAAHSAGKAGKGFEVVAEEVRSLAAQSSEAARNTKELINASVQAVNHGVKMAYATGDTMQVVAQKAAKIIEGLDGISENAQTQEKYAEDIAQNANRISEVVNTNSHTAKSSARAGETLLLQADKLRTAVAKFSLRTEDEELHSEIDAEELIQLCENGEMQIDANVLDMCEEEMQCDLPQEPYAEKQEEIVQKVQIVEELPAEKEEETIWQDEQKLKQEREDFDVINLLGKSRPGAEAQQRDIRDFDIDLD